MKKGDKVKIITQQIIDGFYMYDLVGEIESINTNKVFPEYKIYVEKYKGSYFFMEDELVLLNEDNSTIEKCVLNLWEKLDWGEFSGFEFTNEVKKVMNTPNRYPDTILRSMRKLRQENKINYIVINDKKSLYAKVDLKDEDDDNIDLSAGISSAGGIF